MARPAKKNDDQRVMRLAFRLTPAELAAFKKRVQGSGLEPADYMRQAVLAGRIIIKQTTATHPAVVAELNRIGVNLNQLTRTANNNGRVPEDLDRLCRKIEEVVMKAVDQVVDPVADQGSADGPDDRE